MASDDYHHRNSGYYPPPPPPVPPGQGVMIGLQVCSMVLMICLLACFIVLAVALTHISFSLNDIADIYEKTNRGPLGPHF